MKNTIFGTLLFSFLAFSVALTSCGEENVAPEQNIPATPTLEKRGGTVQIGVVRGGEFTFTVTQDQLENNFGLNVTKNLGQGGELEEAVVYFPDEENGLETPMFHLRGQLDDGESSADVYWEATETDGFVVIDIDPVSIGGICWGCPKCIRYQGGCKCIWGPFGQCKKVIDPTIYWYD